MENYFFNRIYSLTIGYPAPVSGGSGVVRVNTAKVISGLKMTFDIVKTETPESNSATITITNLAEDTRAFIKERTSPTDGMIVILKAGYEEVHAKELPTLFIGDIVGVSHDTTKPDVVTTLDCADGLIAFKIASFDKSYREGVPVSQIINDIIAAMAMPVQYADKNTKKFSFAFYGLPEYKLNRGFTFNGHASDALTRICNAYGLRWSIQNARLKIYPAWKKDGTPWTESKQTFFIGGKETASAAQNIQGVIIGSPKRLTKMMAGIEKEKVKGYEIDMLLVPGIEPGGRVDVNASTIPNSPVGLQVCTVHHKGDTHGQDWKTTIQARDLQK